MTGVWTQTAPACRKVNIHGSAWRVRDIRQNNH